MTTGPSAPAYPKVLPVASLEDLLTLRRRPDPYRSYDPGILDRDETIKKQGHIPMVAG